MQRSRDIPDDSDEKWEYTEHARAKHEVLRRYLGAWLPILGRFHDKLVIYDGFAGRGRYVGGQDGSPVIMFRRAAEAVANGRAKEVSIVCVEANRANYLELETVLSGLHHPGVSISARQDTFDAVANGVADRARQPGVKPPPIFFTADPFGFRGVPLATIERLMAIPRMEVLVTFMVRDQRRFLGMENVEAPLTELFGGDEWKACQGAPDTDRCLVQRYGDVIKRRGIAQWATPFQVFEDERRQTLYYLVHLTDNARGMREMKEAMVETSSDMTFWPVTVRPRDQLVLEVEEAEPYPSLQAHLMQKYAGQRMKFEDVLNDDYPDGTWVEPQYRAAIKDLAVRHAGASIHYDRVTATGKTPSGLEFDDTVEFDLTLL
ncbi:MAG TPA: three-Cys-motif partner protein TcmP [Baekduia sp.]|nr:three-Cys-motif partner protein TcmP [Baekduia sp.]